MSHHYEIEIKSLLGTKKNAAALKSRLAKKFPGLKKLSVHAQLNHYFVGGDFSKLGKALAKVVPKDRRPGLEKILAEGRDFSVRSREADGTVLVVIKASIDSGSSHNTVSRMEFEEPVKGHTLAELDSLILSCGFEYQAKWSREREEFGDKNIHVCIDKNAGYGYLAEFEKLVDREEEAAKTKDELLALMAELGVEELPQARLERMFAHYNAHWPEYYGTDKIFVIE